MTLSIRLLGRPHIERDGRRAPGPRGGKAWALLAYLLLGQRLPSRQQLAVLLFPDADDPLGALRWNLAELRRALGRPSLLSGDPVEPVSTPDIRIDVQVLLAARPGSAAGVEAARSGELLEGMSFASCPAYEFWLVAKRRYLAAIGESLLRESALISLDEGRAREAADIAARLIADDPLQENHHELLIRSLVAAGEHAAARERVKASEELFRRELGVAPSRRLRSLVDSLPGGNLRVDGPMATRARLEAGRAAVSAGAAEVGIEHLRRACEGADSCGEDSLQAQALLALGSALVHAVRDHDRGASILHRAAEVAGRIGDATVAVTANRELALVDVQAGRRERAEIRLTEAEDAAGGSERDLAAIHGVRGMNLSDAARYPEALAALTRSVDSAGRCGDRRQAAWSTSLIGRLHLLTGDHAAAREALERALRTVESERWIAFLPWPEALLAQVDLHEGRREQARARLEHAFTIACQLADPCWEGMAARGLGVSEAERCCIAPALAWLTDARARCTRVPAPYQWVHGWVIDALCAVALREGDPRAGGWIDEFERLAVSTGMREFAARAYLHRHRLGQHGAMEAARALAADIDNPALELPVRG